MASEFPKHASGRLIAVNENYICYSIKGNLIRVIHFIQVTRNKLEPHPAPLVDMEFTNADKLASLDSAGTLRVRRIFEQDGECNYSTDLNVSLPAADAARRVCWGPPASESLAVAVDSTVLLMNLREVIDTLGPGYMFGTLVTNDNTFAPSTLAECGSCGLGHEAAVTDLCFSPDYSCLVSASEDGTARLWSFKADLECRGVLTPFAGRPICSALFVAGDDLVFGSFGNRELTYWAAGGQGGSHVESHALKLQGLGASGAQGAGEAPEDGPWTNLAVVPGAPFLLLANVAQNQLFVVHLGREYGRGFDLVTAWDLAHPVLSLVPKCDEAGEVAVFCIQTKAIQKYTLPLDVCTPDPNARLVVPEEAQLSPLPSTPPPRPPSPAAPPTMVATAVAAPAPIAPPAAGPAEALGAKAAPPPPAAQDAGAAAGPAAGPLLQEAGASPDLAQHFSALEARLCESVGAQVKSLVEEAVESKLKSAHVLARKDLDAKMAEVAHGLTGDLARTVGASAQAAVDAGNKKLAADLDAKVRAALKQGSHAQAQAVQALVAAETKKLKEEVVAAVASDVRAPIVSAFRQTFEELLIPGLEAAMQRMQAQVQESLAAQVAAFSARPQANPKATAAAPDGQAASLDPKQEIEELLASREYEEAMLKALGAQDLGLVAWLCTKVDPSILHDDDGGGGGQGGRLSQTVLICLLQQLGAELNTATAMKLGWLKEVALNLDQDDEKIKVYAPRIVGDLKEKMRAFQGTDAGKKVRTELSLILRVL